MGTSWSVQGFADLDRARLEMDIEEMLQRIVREMSQWEPHSDLSRFNALPAGGEAIFPEDFRTVLTCALTIADETDGAFDPTLGALVDLWGFGPHAVQDAPGAADIDAAHKNAGWKTLNFDASTGRAVQPGGLRLDLAGIAKGYAIDRLARLLCEQDVLSFLIEIGGEVRGHGVKPDGRPWWVEIERAPESDAPMIVAALYNVAIATSGDYRRAGALGGQWITHTIDPRSGRPLATPISAVTVLHPECMRADAYATALMAMGVERGVAFADKNDLAAMFTLRTETGAEEVFSAAFARQLA
jgi:thiamine biosynthesis lipoprotein